MMEQDENFNEMVQKSGIYLNMVTISWFFTYTEKIVFVSLVFTKLAVFRSFVWRESPFLFGDQREAFSCKCTHYLS